MNAPCQNCKSTSAETRVCKKCGFSGCGKCYTSTCPKCQTYSFYSGRKDYR